ncbi:hypothetical protein PIB30_017584 [Stylosanthes scabra]|uniref:Uncharacterized protein n=1 Tax=Stylosanthes scabra TaxID=79078 RepID=A0ABU6U6F2_9FABA|nr:hypothetical protein [Stylosanthes scabra]
MVSSYSSFHTNLGKDSTYFDATPTTIVACWEDAFAVFLRNWKENNNHTEVWSVEYKIKQNPNTNIIPVCAFQLKANRDNNGVESIHFGITDSSSQNETKFSLTITRVARDGLSGGISSFGSSSAGAPVLFTRAKESYTIETTAHYYINQTFALSVTANRNKNGNGFYVEPEGPTKHPNVELRKVLTRTCQTGTIWHSSSSSISISNNNDDDDVIGSKKVPSATISNKNGVSKNSTLLKAAATTAEFNHHEDQQGVNKQAMYSGNNNVEFHQCKRCIIIVNGNKSSANFSGATINSGNYSADQNRNFTTNNYGSPTFNSSGTFHGGGGGYIPTRSSYNDYYGGFYNY